MMAVVERFRSREERDVGVEVFGRGRSGKSGSSMSYRDQLH